MATRVSTFEGHVQDELDQLEQDAQVLRAQVQKLAEQQTLYKQRLARLIENAQYVSPQN